MLHPQYFTKGSEIDLPEIEGHLDVSGCKFVVEGVPAGGMGLCIHLRHVTSGNHYALKGILPEYLGDKAASDRFGDELQIWLSASMCSMIAEAISIVRIDDTPCVLAAWMKGGNLASALPKMTASRKFEVLVRILRGLRWVYENLKVIHRDLKPANILLDETEQAYVADWGLSRPVSRVFQDLAGSHKPAGIQRPDRTVAGSFLGTILYAAPEQIMNARGVDFQADIYALGCMMFEFEIGKPPFSGRSIQELADQHLHSQPPKLGGLFKQTALGLENIIARCLKKNPTERFTSYAELEQGVLQVAKQRNFPLERCHVVQRYDRSILGQGHKQQEGILANPDIKGSQGYGVVEFSRIERFLEEAQNLIASGRFREAEQLLAPYYIPDLLGSPGEWNFVHAIAQNYALCLGNIDGRLEEALGIFQRLNQLSGKSSEFYINYGHTLLQASKYSDAKIACERGLRHFPDDLALIGNHTIALLSLGELDSAKESALKRLKLRRDVHAIEEVVNVLQRLVERKRDNDLPAAIGEATIVGQLISEGLQLKPDFYSLILARIRLLRFAHEGGKAAELCKTLIENRDAHRAFVEMAFFHWLEELASHKGFETFFSLLEKYEAHLQTPAVIGMVNELKNTILAEHYMIGRENNESKRIVIREVVEFFLQKSGNAYAHPLMASKILEWLERFDEAMGTLHGFLQDHPSNWEGIKTMCLFLVRAEQIQTAVDWAKYLGTVAPWRPETFDWMSYVYEKAGENSIAQQLEKKGDEVFASEIKLFDDLKSALAMLP